MPPQVLTSAEGIPFAPSRARALSYWLQEAKNDGTWAGIKQRRAPQSTCSVQQREAATVGQVKASDFLAQVLHRSPYISNVSPMYLQCHSCVASSRVASSRTDDDRLERNALRHPAE